MTWMLHGLDSYFFPGILNFLKILFVKVYIYQKSMSTVNQFLSFISLWKLPKSVNTPESNSYSCLLEHMIYLQNPGHVLYLVESSH